MRHHVHLYIPTLVLLVAAALAMAIQGTCNIDIAHHWAFIAVTVLMVGLCGWQVFQRHHGHWKGNGFSHAGFALLVVTMIAGVPWNESGRAVVPYDEAVRIAYTTDKQPLASPFEMQLVDFQIDYYEDGQHVRQYTSTLRVKDITYSDTTFHLVSTSVNHPGKFQDYYLYQDSYDVANLRYSVIKIIKEPLMPVIYLALLMLAIGAILQIPAHWKMQVQWLWKGTLGLAVVFTLLSVMRIQLGYLMPALRSWWFVPHLAFYMIAYAMLAISIVLMIIKKRRLDPDHKLSNTISSLLHTSSSLLLLGMICGAVWAKQAWGDYWTWDPKECWAAATWFFSLAAVHSTRASKSKFRAMIRIIMTIICFLAMQITWYGINHLPSAKDSLHTYNRK